MFVSWLRCSFMIRDIGSGVMGSFHKLVQGGSLSSFVLYLDLSRLVGCLGTAGKQLYLSRQFGRGAAQASAMRRHRLPPAWPFNRPHGSL